MTGDFDLQRFVDAQNEIYANALDEIRRGCKRSHWMWYVFPQIAGLGSSAMSQRYAIASTEEGRSFLAHPILRARYIECVSALQDLTGTDPIAIFGESMRESFNHHLRSLKPPSPCRSYRRPSNDGSAASETKRR